MDKMNFVFPKVFFYSDHNNTQGEISDTLELISEGWQECPGGGWDRHVLLVAASK